MEHYRVVRRNTDRSIMLYNNPANTAATALSPHPIADLVAQDVVHMVKGTMESVVPVHDLAMLVGDQMRIFYCSFLAAYEALAAGAHGWTSGVLNIVIRAVCEMYHALVIERNLELGFALWKHILPITHLYTHQQLGPVSDIPIYSGILDLWGRYGGFLRSPFLALSSDQMKCLEQRLASIGWLQQPVPVT